MHLLLAVHHFPPRRQSGAELRAYRLAKWLIERNHQVQVICIESVDDSSQGQGLGHTQDVYDGVSVQRLTFDLITWPDPVRWAFDNPLLYQHFRHLIDATSPDLVHVISGYLIGIAPLRAAQEARIPTVVTLTDFWFLCPTLQFLRGDGTLCWEPESAECVRCWLNRRRPFHWLETHIPIITRPVASLVRRRILVPRELLNIEQIFSERQRRLRQTLNQVQAILCVTQFLADVHIANGISPELIRVIPYLQSSPAELTNGTTQGQPYKGQVHFAYLGVVSPHKGADVLVRAFRHLRSGKEANLTIFGPIHPLSFEKRLRKLSGHDSSIQFAGRYQHDHLQSILTDVDVIVVPSLWHENAPRTIVEAFQHGKPVIGSQVGGIAALVHDGVNGLLFERGDARSLAYQMQKIVDDPGLIDYFRANIPQLLVGDIENERVFQVYLDVLGGSDNDP